MYKIVILLVLIFISKIANSSNYELELYMHVIAQKSIIFPDKNKYIQLSGTANWTDTDGDYGVINCLATITTNHAGDTADLDANCEAKNYKNEKFWINLSRTSNMNAGVGITTYLYGDGKYEKYTGKKCAYAVKHFEDKMFYKQQCKK